MPDDVTLDNGNLPDFTVSADETLDGKKIERVKLTYSADGSATHVPADADGLLVNLGANNDVGLSHEEFNWDGVPAGEFDTGRTGVKNPLPTRLFYFFEQTGTDDPVWTEVTYDSPLPVTLGDNTKVDSPVVHIGTGFFGGPSNGVWNTQEIQLLDGASYAVFVAMPGWYSGSPTVGFFAHGDPGNNAVARNQQLPVLIPRAGGLVHAATFTPSATETFCYLPLVPPSLEVRATAGGTSTPVVGIKLHVYYHRPLPVTITAVPA